MPAPEGGFRGGGAFPRKMPAPEGSCRGAGCFLTKCLYLRVVAGWLSCGVCRGGDKLHQPKT
eukprot:8717906-Ditylum_brightwellii.AAC.1